MFLDHSKWLVAIAPKSFFPLFRMGFGMDVTTETCPEFRLVTNVSYTLFHMLHEEHFEMVVVAECCTPFDNFYRENKIFGPFSPKGFLNVLRKGNVSMICTPKLHPYSVTMLSQCT